MFEMFTDDSRRIVVMAQEECRRLGHHQIDPEHLLLALLMQPAATGTRLLTACGVDVGALRDEVERATEPGPPSTERGGHIPFNPLTKRILERSLRESKLLKHRHIGTEHILLALICADGSAAATALDAALRAAGMDLDRVRERIGEIESTETAEPRPESGGRTVEDDPSLRAIRAAKDAALDRGDLQAAAAFRDQEKELLRHLRERIDPAAG